MKKILDFIPTHILGLYILGVLTQFYTHLIPNFYFGVSCLFVFNLVCHFFCKKAAVFSLFFIGALAIIVQEEQKLPINNIDEFYELTIAEVLKENSKSKRYYAKNVFRGKELFKNKLLLAVEKGEIGFEVGDKIVVNGLIKEIASPKNPYSFNYKDYLKKKNVHAQIYLTKGTCQIISRNALHPVRIANRFRSKISDNLKNKLTNSDVRSITNAMLLGKRNEMSEGLLQNFSDAGAIHVLAVSGLHVGILLLLLNFLLKPLEYLKHGKRLKLVVLIFCLWSFALVAGLSPSVVRAVTMFSFVAIGLFMNKENSVFYSLISSALVLLFVNPYYIFDVGFQMSYLAVFSIVWIQPMIYCLWEPKYKLFDYLWNLISVSLAAQIGVLPLSLYYFHQFPALFLITNIIVIPAVGFVLIFGILVLILAQFDRSPKILFDVYNGLLELFIGFVNWVGSFEAAVIKEIYFSKLKLYVIYLFLFLLFAFFERRKVYKLKMVLGMVIVLQLTFFYERIIQKGTNELIVCNKYKSSLIIQNKNGRVDIFTNDSTLDSKIITEYMENSGGIKNKIVKKIPEVFSFNNEVFFVVNKRTNFNIDGFFPSIIILQNSPKINLERLLLKLKPKKVIADGSNYFSLKEKWKSTCEKHNVAFYDTYASGAFVSKINPVFSMGKRRGLGIK